jgi:hypothetical protein
MRIEDQRRSSNFEDRGTGRGGSGGGGVPIQALLSLVSVLGFKGILLAGAVLAIVLHAAFGDQAGDESHRRER